jgi:hypothetical protein
MRNGEWVLKTSKSPKTKTNLGEKLPRRPQQNRLYGCRAALTSRNSSSGLYSQFRTETDARKKDNVIFVLISRTNFSRSFVPQTPLRPLSTKFFKLQQLSSN